MKKFITPEDKTLILDRIEQAAMQNALNQDDGYELEMFILRYALTHGDDEPAIAVMFNAFKSQFWEGES